MKKSQIILSFILFIFAFNSLTSQDKLVQVSAFPSKLTVKEGEKFWIKVEIKIDKNHYTYSFNLQEGEFGGPTQSEIHFAPENDIKIAGKIITPKPKVKYDSAFFMNIEYYKGKFSVEVPVIAQKIWISQKIGLSQRHFCNSAQRRAAYHLIFIMGVWFQKFILQKTR